MGCGLLIHLWTVSTSTSWDFTLFVRSKGIYPPSTASGIQVKYDLPRPTLAHPLPGADSARAYRM